MQFKGICFVILILTLALQSCVTNKPSSKTTAELRMDLGMAYLQQNNLALALKELLIAQDLDASNPFIQNNLGIVYYLRDKYEISLKHFQNAVNLKPNFTEARNNLGRTQIELKKYAEAEKNLKAVVSDLTYEGLNKGYFNLGLLYFNQQKYQQALPQFQKSLKAYRDDCLSQVYFGRTYLELKQNKVASEQLDRSAVVCNGVGIDDGLFYSAIANFRNNQTEKAIAKFNEFISLYPESPKKPQALQMLDFIEKSKK